MNPQLKGFMDRRSFLATSAVFVASAVVSSQTQAAPPIRRPRYELLPGLGSEQFLWVDLPGLTRSAATALPVTQPEILQRFGRGWRLLPVGNLDRWDFLTGALARRLRHRDSVWCAGYFSDSQRSWRSDDSGGFQARLRWMPRNSVFGQQPDSGYTTYTQTPPYTTYREKFVAIFKIDTFTAGVDISDGHSAARGAILWRTR
jgi:hypothetical protein